MLAQRGGQRLLLGGVAEVGEEPVVAEDGEAGVFERDERHQRVAVLAVAADLVGVGARGLVAVVAVGDQELRSRVSSAVNGRDDLRVVNAPDAVDGAVGVGGLAPRLALGSRFEVGPGVALVEGEDRREVVAGRLGQAQAVLLRAGLGALVRADQAGAVVGDSHPAEKAAPRVPRAVGPVVLLLERPERFVAVAPRGCPGASNSSSVSAACSYGSPPPGDCGQVDLDDVERRTAE